MLGEGPDAATVRVTEHDDVLDLEHLHGEFEGSEDTVTEAIGLIGGHQVRNIAHDKQLARVSIEDHLR